MQEFNGALILVRVVLIHLHEGLQIGTRWEEVLNRGQTYAISLFIRVVKGHLAVVKVLLLLGTDDVWLLI